MIKEVKDWTYDKYYELDDQNRYEIYDGELVMSPAPKPLHQKVIRKLYDFIRNHIIQKHIGELYFSPIDVVFAENVVCQPDLLFISTERLDIVDDDKAIFGAPDVIIEIASPSTEKHDRNIKFDIYERHGVLEYWIISLADKSAEVYFLSDGCYKLIGDSRSNDIVSSQYFSGFEIDIKNIF